MFVKEIRVNNFKSFAHLNINLEHLNVIIGANASGKSNFIHIFEFLRNIARHGLENAISMEGGVEYLRNLQIGNSQPLSIGITYQPKRKLAKNLKSGEKLGIIISQIDYDFTLKFHKRGKGFNITQDKTNILYRFVRLDTHQEPWEEKKEIGTGRAVFEINPKRQINLVFEIPSTLSLNEDDLFPAFFWKSVSLPKHTLFLETPFFQLLHPLQTPIADITIYDIDPKLPKKAVPITGKTDLEEDGSNLSIKIKDIVANDNDRRKFLNLLQDLLTFVNDVRVQKSTDRSLIFTLKEEYKYKNQHKYLPASFISDGTINLTALITALYFEKKSLVIIEEPERNIHPFLISKIQSMFAEVSQNQQIIITTHNPEFVKHTDAQSLLLMSRNQQGFSEILKPYEIADVQIFLENEMGIDELYIQNLLGVHTL